VQRLVEWKLAQSLSQCSEWSTPCSSSRRIKFTSVCAAVSPTCDTRLLLSRVGRAAQRKQTRHRLADGGPLLLCESSFAAEISCIFDKFLVLVIMNWRAELLPTSRQHAPGQQQQQQQQLRQKWIRFINTPRLRPSILNSIRCQNDLAFNTTGTQKVVSQPLASSYNYSFIEYCRHKSNWMYKPRGNGIHKC